MTLRLTLLLLASLLVGRAALACHCTDTPTTQEELKRATAVFAGKVVDPGDESAPHHTATFAVTRTWKGTVPGTVRVQAGSGQDSCGFSFAPREVYLVYAFGPSDALWTDACTLTKGLMNARRDLKVLGPGKAFQGQRAPNNSGRELPWIGFGVVAVIGVWAWRLARTRRTH